MLSILIPVYNYDIRELVREVYQQAFDEHIPFEVLIADDASSDETLKKNNQYYEQLQHCRIYNFTENKGRAFTRDFLAKKARYDWLLFLDADVMPVMHNFISEFLQVTEDKDLIFGGVVYEEQKPESGKILRWKYGRKREGKPVEVRNQNPYHTIISGALFIRKNLFLRSNKYLKNAYGLDSIFVNKLKKNNAKILHIDNPVYHLGLESDLSFIRKTKKGLETLADLEQKGKVSPDYRPVQKAYKKLNRFHLTRLYRFMFKPFRKLIQKNLMSNNPNLFFFDLYKLDYFIGVKSRKK